jgi:IPT/TIG domain-containing protein
MTVVSLAAVLLTAAAGYAPVRVSNIRPRSGPAKGGTDITITGSGFEPGARVAFGYAPASGGYRYATNVKVADPGTITATTPSHEPGTVDVIVTDPDGSSAVATAAFSFQ